MNPQKLHERWGALGGIDRSAVIRHTNGSPPTFKQLEGEYSHWLRAWCPTYELAKQIAAEHNIAIGAYEPCEK